MSLGERSERLMERRNRAIPRGVSHATPVFADRAEGVYIWDVEGRRYIDFAGGIGVQNLGHRPHFVLDAVQAQLERFIHTSFNVAPYELYIELAEKLAALAPGAFAKKTLLVNSGAEAVENAVKIARSYTKRSAIVAFTYGFHGRTLLTMTLTGKTRPYRAGFGPMAPEVYHIPYPYPYRDPLGYDPQFGVLAANRLLELFDTEVPAEQVAAVIVEPVAGEGGFIVPPPEFLPRLREITQEHGILLIADEIQTGFGRTGRLFAVEHNQVVPDLMVLAKSLAAGFPLSAVVGRAEVMDAPQVGGLGGTYAGNPVAVAAALSVVNYFLEHPEVLEQARHLGQVINARFQEFSKRYDIVGEARGLGPMAALELVESKASRRPSTAHADLVAQYAYEHGLILMRAGMANHVIRTLMPIIMTDDVAEDALMILEDAIRYARDQARR